jgi:hypothetical protein
LLWGPLVVIFLGVNHACITTSFLVGKGLMGSYLVGHL